MRPTRKRAQTLTRTTLELYRISRGWTRSEAAKVTGVWPSCWHAWETGQNPVPIWVLMLLSVSAPIARDDLLLLVHRLKCNPASILDGLQPGSAPGTYQNSPLAPPIAETKPKSAKDLADATRISQTDNDKARRDFQPGGSGGTHGSAHDNVYAHLNPSKPTSNIIAATPKTGNPSAGDSSVAGRPRANDQGLSTASTESQEGLRDLSSLAPGGSQEASKVQEGPETPEGVSSAPAVNQGVILGGVGDLGGFGDSQSEAGPPKGRVYKSLVYEQIEGGFEQSGEMEQNCLAFSTPQFVKIQVGGYPHVNPGSQEGLQREGEKVEPWGNAEFESNKNPQCLQGFEHKGEVSKVSELNKPHHSQLCPKCGQTLETDVAHRLVSGVARLGGCQVSPPDGRGLPTHVFVQSEFDLTKPTTEEPMVPEGLEFLGPPQYRQARRRVLGPKGWGKIWERYWMPVPGWPPKVKKPKVATRVPSGAKTRPTVKPERLNTYPEYLLDPESARAKKLKRSREVEQILAAHPGVEVVESTVDGPMYDEWKALWNDRWTETSMWYDPVNPSWVKGEGAGEGRKNRWLRHKVKVSMKSFDWVI